MAGIRHRRGPAFALTPIPKLGKQPSFTALGTPHNIPQPADSRRPWMPLQQIFADICDSQKLPLDFFVAKDSVISPNCDLVVERAARGIAKSIKSGSRLNGLTHPSRMARRFAPANNDSSAPMSDNDDASRTYHCSMRESFLDPSPRVLSHRTQNRDEFHFNVGLTSHPSWHFLGDDFILSPPHLS